MVGSATSKDSRRSFRAAAPGPFVVTPLGRATGVGAAAPLLAPSAPGKQQRPAFALAAPRVLGFPSLGRHISAVAAWRNFRPQQCQCRLRYDPWFGWRAAS
mmetsp:Transcript_107783/g.230105  ORF Transcript_107783/g.230105 Transcript_107783/m.230105 type:complete len:101 (+) Transcript_107783:126-428(+)